MTNLVKRHPERTVILSFLVGVLLYLLTGWYVLVDISCLPGFYMFVYGCNELIKEHMGIYNDQ